MQRQPSPLKRSSTEANLSRQRSGSPPPQPPTKGRPTSPRDSSTKRAPKGHGAESSNSEPASPATSPRRNGTSRKEGNSTAAQIAIAAYRDGSEPILSSSEGLGLEGKRGGGSSRHHGGEGSSSRLEREHKDLVKAFGDKCEQLRASHAARSGVELRMAQLEAVGSTEVMKQRLEAAEASAKAASSELRAERQRHHEREAELLQLLAQRDKELAALRGGGGVPPAPVASSTLPRAPLPHLLAATGAALGGSPPGVWKAGGPSSRRSSSSSIASGGSPPGGPLPAVARPAPLEVGPAEAGSACEEPALLELSSDPLEDTAADDDDDDDEEEDGAEGAASEEEEEEGEEEEEEEEEEEGEEEDEGEEEEEEEELEAEEVAASGTASLSSGPLISPPSSLGISSQGSARSLSEGSLEGSSERNSEPTGASPPPTPQEKPAHRPPLAKPLVTGKAERLAAMEAELGAVVEAAVGEKSAKLFASMANGGAAPPPPRNAHNANNGRPAGGTGAGAVGVPPVRGLSQLADDDFLSRLTRAESQPSTPTSAH